MEEKYKDHLTGAEEEIFEYIDGLDEIPDRYEIADEVGYSSETVRRTMLTLAAKGYKPVRERMMSGYQARKTLCVEILRENRDYEKIAEIRKAPTKEDKKEIVEEELKRYL